MIQGVKLRCRRSVVSVLIVGVIVGSGAGLEAQRAAAPPAGPTRAVNELAAASQRATDAMNDGKYGEAIAIYRELLKARPRDPGLMMNLGIALAMAGREAEAVEPLSRAVAARPALVPAHLFLGSSYLALGQPDKAVPPLEKASAARPTDAESLGLLAQARLASGDAPRAAAAFRRLTELAPALPAAWYGLAQSYMAVAQQAIESFDADAPESPWRHLLVAEALRDGNRLGAALAEYRAALPGLPSSKSALEAIAAIYQRSGHADWAQALRTRAAAASLDCAAHRAECDTRAGRHRTVLAATSGRTDAESRYWRARAATALTDAAFATLDKLPDSRERREMRAEIARAEGRHRDSAAEIEAALKFSPDDPRLLEELATSHYLARDYEKAVAGLKPLLAQSPDSPSLLALSGEALLELQQLDAAIPALERALRLDASDAAARVALGRAYVLAGRFAPAIPLLEPALADDEDGLLHFQLARAYQGTGQTEKAAPLLDRYKELQAASAKRAESDKEAPITPPGQLP
jgi:cellulose synthase operon protein C